MRTILPGRGALALVPVLAAAALVPGPARAVDRGVYLGASVGRADTALDAGELGRFDRADLGFKVYAGVRPLAHLAAEAGYVDFGRPRQSLGDVRAGADLKGAAAFGLVYLPLPVPLVDVYGKVGLSRLDSTVSAATFRADRTDTSFAWGLGGQVRWGSLAVRAEFERFRAGGARPEFVSVGVNWTFL
jgi:OOP family OmpA-OmpF porin